MNVLLKKRIAIIGSTGSIGTQTLDIVKDYPESFDIKYLATYQNVDMLEEQALKFSPDKVVLIKEDNTLEFEKRMSAISTKAESGKKALLEMVTRDDIDVIVMALVGIAGLEPTIAALKTGKTVALANKEVLVAGGELITRILKETGGHLIPIDSEHSAIFQCLQGNSDLGQVNRIFLTASGGPFRGYKRENLKRVALQDALKHPNWEMGKKITIDSATLMNKGLEVIEAKWIFDLDIDQIDVVVHPQSIIHSMVEFVDGSVLAQMGIPDMRIPILYALTYPERFPTKMKRLNLVEMGTLSFEEPDMDTFSCLSLGYKSIKIGGTMPVVLNAANEVAVELFLKEKISFLDIPVIIEKAMKSHQVIKQPELQDILRIDEETRRTLLQKDGVL